MICFSNIKKPNKTALKRWTKLLFVTVFLLLPKQHDRYSEGQGRECYLCPVELWGLWG